MDNCPIINLKYELKEDVVNLDNLMADGISQYNSQSNVFRNTRDVGVAKGNKKFSNKDWYGRSYQAKLLKPRALSADSRWIKPKGLTKSTYSGKIFDYSKDNVMRSAWSKEKRVVGIGQGDAEVNVETKRKAVCMEKGTMTDDCDDDAIVPRRKILKKELEDLEKSSFAYYSAVSNGSPAESNITKINTQIAPYWNYPHLLKKIRNSISRIPARPVNSAWSFPIPSNAVEVSEGSSIIFRHVQPANTYIFDGYSDVDNESSKELFILSNAWNLTIYVFVSVFGSISAIVLVALIWTMVSNGLWYILAS